MWENLYVDPPIIKYVALQKFGQNVYLEVKLLRWIATYPLD